MKNLKSLAAGLALAVLSLGSAFGQGVGQLGSGQMFANPTANAARAQPTNASAYFDFVYGSTRGAILERGASGWTIVGPGSTAGLAWVSNGAGADPSYQTVAGAAFGTQTAHFVFAGPSTGSPANPTFRLLVGGDLPAPGASSLGGVQSLTCSTHNWFNSLSTGGVFACTQPSFADLSSSLACSQTPALTGDVTTSAGACATTIAANAVTNAKMATMNAWTIKMNNTSGAATPTDTTIDGLTLKASPASSDEIPIWDAAGTAMKKATVSSIASAGSVASFDTLTGAITFLTEPQGRLTLAANTPVMTTTQSAQTTLRYDCYIGGGQVPYYTGSVDAYDTIASCEVTDAMVSAASAGQVVSGQVYDAWWVHGGANRICLAMSASTGGGGGWASDTGGSATARGTGYTQLDRVTRPYITNKNAIANCFNGATNYGSVSANQATYLGTITATANGQISFTFGTSTAGGGTATLSVWNMYNRRPVNTTVLDSFNTSACTSTPAQALDATGTGSGLNNRVNYVIGVAEDPVSASVAATVATTSGVSGVGIGHDSTSSYAAGPVNGSQVTANASVTGSAVINGDIGLHFLQALQGCSGGSSTFAGSLASGPIQTGMSFTGQF